MKISRIVIKKTQLLLNCIVVWAIFGCIATMGHKDNYFSTKEMELLIKTTESIDYGYGYDKKLDLNYVYSHSYSRLNFKQKEKSFADIVVRTDGQQYLQFYKKVYGLYVKTKNRIKEYKESKKWKKYTYLKKYLLPPLETYYLLVEKYLLKKQPELKDKLQSIKEHIEKSQKLKKSNKTSPGNDES